MPTGFVKNAHRVDLYKTYKFRIVMDGDIVLGVNKVGPLKRTTTVVPYRSGGENSRDHKSPGRTQYDGLTLERGITHDVAFERWANRVHPPGGDTGMDLVGYKKDLILEVMDEKGLVVLRYSLYGCWVSEFTAVPALDASANETAIEMIKIELEHWERDTSTQEPNEADPVPLG